MSRPFFKDFRVTDLFEVRRGRSELIKTYFLQNSGGYPVYSASTDDASVAGWIDSYDFDTECLTWTTNGYAGHVFKRTGRFSCTRDVGVLVPKEALKELLVLDYFVPALSTTFQSAATGRFKEDGRPDYTKIATKKAATLFVSVPVDSAGLPDPAAQEEISSRFKAVRNIQLKLADAAEHIEALRITNPAMDGNCAEFAINDLFEEPRRGNGGITKRYIIANPGPYPVYSGASNKNDAIGFINTFDFEDPCLTWVADGYAGFVFARNEKFSANSHCGILRPKEAYSNKIHLPFFEIFLTPLLLDAAVGRFRDDGSPDYTRVTAEMVKQTKMLIPIDENGEPDLDTQIKLASRAHLLDEKKREIVSKLRKKSCVSVNIQGLEAA